MVRPTISPSQSPKPSAPGNECGGCTATLKRYAPGSVRNAVCARASMTKSSTAETTRIAAPTTDMVTDAACMAIAGSA